MVRIIAECAQGYYQDTIQESINLAKMLLKVSEASGADAVKFQLVQANELSTEDYEHYHLFKKLELGYEGWKVVRDLANELKIELIFDIFGTQSLRIAESLGIKTIKLHPTDFRNEALLEAVLNSTNINSVIAGCGGSYANEIINTLKKFKDKKHLTLLHGFQGYPTPENENCLNRIKTLREIALSIGLSSFDIGFADHSEPTSINSNNLSIMAIGLGIGTIEKHITLSRCLNLEDNESALSPDEFENFVDLIRGMDIYFGKEKYTTFDFDLTPKEIKYRNSCNRHLVSSKELKSGQIIKEDDISFKRSSSKNPIINKDDIIGKKLVRDIAINQYFTNSDFA